MNSNVLGESFESCGKWPSTILHGAPLIERQIAVGEQRHGVIERLLRVVAALQNIAYAKILVCLHQVTSGCSASGGNLRRHAVLALLGNTQHAEHEHAVIGHDRAAAFRNNRRMLYFASSQARWM